MASKNFPLKGLVSQRKQFFDSTENLDKVDTKGTESGSYGYRHVASDDVSASVENNKISNKSDSSPEAEPKSVIKEKLVAFENKIHWHKPSKLSDKNLEKGEGSSFHDRVEVFEHLSASQKSKPKLQSKLWKFASGGLHSKKSKAKLEKDDDTTRLLEETKGINISDLRRWRSLDTLEGGGQSVCMSTSGGPGSPNNDPDPDPKTTSEEDKTNADKKAAKPHWTAVFSQRLQTIRQMLESRCSAERAKTVQQHFKAGSHQAAAKSVSGKFYTSNMSGKKASKGHLKSQDMAQFKRIRDLSLSCSNLDNLNGVSQKADADPDITEADTGQSKLLAEAGGTDRQATSELKQNLDQLLEQKKERTTVQNRGKSGCSMLIEFEKENNVDGRTTRESNGSVSERAAPSSPAASVGGQSTEKSHINAMFACIKGEVVVHNGGSGPASPAASAEGKRDIPVTGTLVMNGDKLENNTVEMSASKPADKHGAEIEIVEASAENCEAAKCNKPLTPVPWKKNQPITKQGSVKDIEVVPVAISEEVINCIQSPLVGRIGNNICSAESPEVSVDVTDIDKPPDNNNVVADAVADHPAASPTGSSPTLPKQDQNGNNQVPEPVVVKSKVSMESPRIIKESSSNQKAVDPVTCVNSTNHEAQPMTNGYAEPHNVGRAINGVTPQKSKTVVISTPETPKTGPLAPPHIVQSDKEGFTTDELVKERITLKNWDPTLLMKDLYEVKLQPETEVSSQYINMEGYMEKLPTNKKKATLLKTWKRRYFRAKDGTLYYFESAQESKDARLSTVEPDFYWEESGSGEKASACFHLMGGSVEDLGGRMIGVDDGRGRYLVVRCPTDQEFLDWKKALVSQMGGNVKATYVKPVLVPQPSTKRKVVIIDIGSCSVRAGLLGEKPSLPSQFFPTVTATDPSGGRLWGIEAYTPDVRNSSTISYPVRPSVRIDRSIDMEVMADLFKKIFTSLKADATKHWVMLSSPANLSDKIKEQFMDILVKQFNVKGVSIANQTLVAMYSYNTKSGIMVDIGERLEIVPVTDGYVVEGGVTKQVYGGHRVGEAFNIALTERKYPFFADTEYQIVRLAMEKMCFVSENYEEAVKHWNKDPNFCRDSLSLDKYNLPEGFIQEITIDLGRFKAPEGLFNTEVWGMDNPSLPKLIQKAVQASPLDTRREMWRSIYLSGGATMMAGFAERLQAELNKIVPDSIVVEVHASPQRYHAAYIGACTLAGLPQFEQSCIRGDEWLKEGPKVLRKWHMY